MIGCDIMNIVKLKDGEITEIHTDYSTLKPCNTCTAGLTTIHEICMTIYKRVNSTYEATVYEFSKSYEYDLTGYRADYDENGANFIDVVSLFNRDFSNTTVKEFIQLLNDEGWIKG